MAMKLELKKKKIEGRTVWEWWVKDKREIVAGGMSDTRKNASNDAQIWMDAHAIGAMNQANDKLTHGGENERNER